MLTSVDASEINSVISKWFESFPVHAEFFIDEDHKAFHPKCPVINKMKKTGMDFLVRGNVQPVACDGCSVSVCPAANSVLKPVTKNNRVVGILQLTPFDNKDGWLSQNLSVIELQMELCCEWIGNKMEIADLRKENSLVLEEMVGLFSFIQEPILLVGHDGTIHSISNQVSLDFDIDRTTISGEHIEELISPADWLKIKTVKTQQELKIKISSVKHAHAIAKVKPLLVNKDLVSFIIQLKPAKDVKKGAMEQRMLYTFDDVKGISEHILTVIDMAKRVAPSNSSILLRGESGTGKEVFAQSIHHDSNRSKGPFVALNCAAIPESLLESELFGHVKGAFTGSNADKPGRFELANGGTIFLDEIGDLSLSLQAKLLRVVQERKIERVGDTKSTPVDVRIITATHRNLEELVARGEFREDLYYRLNVIPITIPPLRERKEDIPLLVEYFLKKFSGELFSSPKSLSTQVYDILLHYHWPGNIRELQNVVYHFVQLQIGNLVTVESLPGYLRDLYMSESGLKKENNFAVTPNTIIHTTEKDMIIELLDLYGRDTQGKKKVAKHLKISLPTLYRRISKLQIK
ncbi:sigma-54 interaction domain-containing protein [Peribacillus sp. SCS-155]|uniref:sigma-54 interaction domain-containing protein n=1 Tax=Peribacillus sedimenti TaxID=3115297 RepID=UPI00390592E3